ncbi:hypothetical protein [Sphingobium aromaticiconvertens]|uniref:hypothetical protein n=1 Tax=Sphingobium aromaticiconvertens TaxID=365341 RepID=UPI0030166BF6
MPQSQENVPSPTVTEAIVRSLGIQADPAALTALADNWAVLMTHWANLTDRPDREAA